MSMLRKKGNHIDYGFMMGKASGMTTIPSDIDMVYEHCGHFLFGEWKYSDIAGTGFEETLSDGQSIMLSNLSKMPGTKVLVVYYNDGSDGYPNIVRFCEVTGGLHTEVGRGQDAFIDYCSKWWRSVE